MDRALWDKAKEVLMRNDYFRRQYEEAPSDECKRYFHYSAYRSIGSQYDQALRDQVQGALNVQDWKYILKHNGNNPHVLYIRKKIAELQGKA